MDATAHQPRCAEPRRSMLLHRCADLFVIYPLAGVLFSAGILKAISLTSAHRPQVEIFPRRLVLTIVLVELGLGVLLCARLWVLRVRVAAFLFMSVALVVSFRAALREASCGCFGPVSINSWVTAGFDAMSLLAILVSLLHIEAGRKRGWRSGTFRLLAVVSASALAAGIAAHAGAAKAVPAALLDLSRSYVLLNPASWQGQELPLLPYIDIGGKLSNGRWTVVLYHHDCDRCRALIAKMVDRGGEGSPVALVELPPFAQSNEALADGKWCVLGRIDAHKSWFVQTPVVMSLADGKVLSVQEASR